MRLRPSVGRPISGLVTDRPAPRCRYLKCGYNNWLDSRHIPELAGNRPFRAARRGGWGNPGLSDLSGRRIRAPRPDRVHQLSGRIVSRCRTSDERQPRMSERGSSERAATTSVDHVTPRHSWLFIRLPACMPIMILLPGGGLTSCRIRSRTANPRRAVPRSPECGGGGAAGSSRSHVVWPCRGHLGFRRHSCRTYSPSA